MTDHELLFDSIANAIESQKELPIPQSPQLQESYIIIRKFYSNSTKLSWPLQEIPF